MAIRESELSTLSSISTSDYVRSVAGGASSKVKVSDLAKTTLEEYSGSKIAGANQSVKSAVDSLDAQFQELIAPTGEAPNPAEIVNARVGADGNTYANLGTAIRNQILDRTAADHALQNSINAESARAAAEEARIEALFTMPTQEAVDAWLDEHPEATTTVQDGAITEIKLSPSARAAVIQAENPLGSKYELDSDDDKIILATYNILSANYWRWPVNPPCKTDEGLVKACRNIRVINPDIIGMNEIPDNPKYTPLMKLKMAGYDYSFFYGDDVVGMQNVKFGNPIMAKEGYEALSERGVTYQDYSSQARSYTNVKFQTPDGNIISVYETHLDLNEEKSALQVAELAAEIQSDSSEYIVAMGDFNIIYNSATYNNVLRDFPLTNTNSTLGTFISTNALIDYIFHSSNMTVIDYGTVENSDASDHRMLWAKFNLI